MHRCVELVQKLLKNRSNKLVKINGKDFLIGCDPEVFVKNALGEVVCAHGLIPGTKQEPYKVRDGMVQVDGMALEFGVDPCETKGEFIEKVNSVKLTLKEMLPKGFSLAIVPCVVFSEKEIKEAPPEALELGCDPDYSGYTMKLTPSHSCLTVLCAQLAGMYTLAGELALIDFLRSSFSIVLLWL